MPTRKRPYKKVSILLIDDDDVDAMAVERAFKKIDFTNPVIRARDGFEGLALLRDQNALRRPFIVLLDINMPRMNGFEFLAALRSDGKLSSSVVFILTTSKAVEDIAAAYAQHVAGYMIKSEVGDGFKRVMDLFESYFQVVELPVTA